jgi:hypothetical protein
MLRLFDASQAISLFDTLVTDSIGQSDGQDMLELGYLG